MMYCEYTGLYTTDTCIAFVTAYSYKYIPVFNISVAYLAYYAYGFNNAIILTA